MLNKHFSSSTKHSDKDTVWTIVGLSMLYVMPEFLPTLEKPICTTILCMDALFTSGQCSHFVVVALWRPVADSSTVVQKILTFISNFICKCFFLPGDCCSCRRLIFCKMPRSTQWCCHVSFHKISPSINEWISIFLLILSPHSVSSNGDSWQSVWQWQSLTVWQDDYWHVFLS